MAIKFPDLGSLAAAEVIYPYESKGDVAPRSRSWDAASLFSQNSRCAQFWELVPAGVFGMGFSWHWEYGNGDC